MLRDLLIHRPPGEYIDRETGVLGQYVISALDSERAVLLKWKQLLWMKKTVQWKKLFLVFLDERSLIPGKCKANISFWMRFIISVTPSRNVRKPRPNLVLFRSWE